MTFRNGFYSTFVTGTEPTYNLFSLTAGTEYTFVATPSVSIDVAMNFYDPNAAYLGTMDIAAAGTYEAASLIPELTGTYAVDLAYSGTLPGNIWLDVYQGTGPQPTVTHAVLSPSTPLNSSIAASYDFGWYAIEMVANTQYVFDLGSAPTLDGQLWLYDSNNSLITSADNGWGGGLAETLYFTPTVAGTYYLSVSGFETTTGNFTLNTTANPLPTGDFVAGDASTLHNLAVSNTLWGQIDDAADADWYGMALLTGHTYRFDLADDVTLDGVLQLYGSDGVTFLGEQNLGFAGDGESAYFTPSVDGTYYIAVDGFDTSTGEFYLTLTDVSSYTGPDVAGNNSTTATLPAHVNGAVDPSGDADWYGVSLDAGKLYQFDLGSASLDGVLALYDASGVELAYADNGWMPGLPETLLFTPTSAGTYYIGVSGYADSTGDFVLDFSAINTDSGPDVVGQTTATAVNLAIDTNEREAVNSATDEDWYQVNLTAGSDYKFDLNSNVLDGTLTLYDATGNWITWTDMGYAGDPEQLFYTPDVSGTYYIGVGGQAGSTGNYDVSYTSLTVSGVDIAGDSSTSASLATPGFATSEVSTGTDTDWFSVRMDGGSEYRFDLYNDSTLDGILTIYDASGTPLAQADNGWFMGDAEFLYFTPATTGNYFVGVSSYNLTSGNYDLYALQTYDATQINWTATDYTDVKWDVIDWSSFNWDAGAAAVDWGNVFWEELPDYSSLDWDYVDWSEFNASDYDHLEYEQVDWNELGDTDWNLIDWTQVFADKIIWGHLQYEESFDPSSGYGTGWNLDTSTNGEGNESVQGGALDDSVFLGEGLDFFLGGEGDDDADGGDGSDMLKGEVGNDTLDGGAGNDVMRGGVGDDQYYVDNGGDEVIEDNNATSSGLGGNIDKVIASINYTLTSYVEDLDLAAGAGELEGTGNDLSNTLNGNESSNLLDGSSGADSLTGGNGNDTLIGGDGNDTLTGGAGSDVFLFTPAPGIGTDLIADFLAGDLIRIENANFSAGSITAGDGSSVGNNEIQVSSSGDVTTLFIGTDNVAGADLVITLTGIFAAAVLDADGTDIEIKKISGTDGNDLQLSGDANDNVIDGGLGADKMTGGAGNDTYFIDNKGDKAIELAGGGDSDEIHSSITFTLPVNVENLTLINGAGNINATGNDDNNTLTGNNGNNLLTGGKGDDTLIGGAGNDTLTGGLGMDAHTGGAGDDLYILDSLLEAATESTDGGTDRIELKIATALAGSAYTLGNNIENLTITGAALIDITGNALDNYLIGNAKASTLTGLLGNDTLDGGKGADTLKGGAGDDTYVIDNAGDMVNEESNTDSDDLIKSSINIDLANPNYAGIEHISLTGKGALKATGNAGVNTLTGNDGANVLDGGAGNDALIGGKGNDTYIVSDSGDAVTEAENAGTDLIKSSVSHALENNVENLTLTGADHINGTGNTLKNTILGNDGNNILDGGDAVDTLKGGKGNDTYLVDLITSGTGTSIKAKLQDTVTEAANQGTDTLELRAGNLGLETATTVTTLTLAKTLENIDISATVSNQLNLTGNTANNELIGNAAINKLDGGDGNDTLTGGAGNDIFIFSKKLNVATNVDTIEDFTTGDQIQLSKAIFSAAGPAGDLAAGFFHVGTGATDANHHIIFDDGTGALYYDKDGNGAGEKVQFASVTLTGIGTLENTDFVVV